MKRKFVCLLIVLIIATACNAQKTIQVKARLNKKNNVIVLKQARKTSINVNLDSADLKQFNGLRFVGGKIDGYTLTYDCGHNSIMHTITPDKPLAKPLPQCIEKADRLTFQTITIVRSKKVYSVRGFEIDIKRDPFKGIELKKP